MCVCGGVSPFLPGLPVEPVWPHWRPRVGSLPIIAGPRCRPGVRPCIAPQPVRYALRPEPGSLPQDHPGSGVVAPWLPPGQLHGISSASPCVCVCVCVCVSGWVGVGVGGCVWVGGWLCAVCGCVCVGGGGVWVGVHAYVCLCARGLRIGGEGEVGGLVHMGQRRWGSGRRLGAHDRPTGPAAHVMRLGRCAPSRPAEARPRTTTSSRSPTRRRRQSQSPVGGPSCGG